MIIILFRKLEAAKFYQNWLFFVYLEVFMRFYIMFGITFLICGYLLLFDPFAKYLGIFQNDFIIEQVVYEDGYHWECNNTMFEMNKVSDNKWEFESDKNGTGSLVFNFVNNEDPKDIKYTVNYEFKVFLNQIFWTVGEAKGLYDFPDPYKK